MHLLDELNEQQRAAVTAAPGPLLIMAGPGTGKTKTLAARIAYLLDSGVPADELVALTYTNKAAREMRERVAALIGTTKGLPIIATFHALCQRLLTEHGETGSLVSNQQRTEILKTLSRPAAFKKRTPRELELIISTAKTALAPPADEPLQQLLTAYQAALTEHGVQDFDDLLLRGLQRLSTSQVRYSHVLVDEFQDTSDLQYAILKLLSSAGHVVAIGDPRQSIYSFRGAGMAMFERFRADFPNARTVALAANYRSAPEIVAAANAIFPSTAPLIPQATVPGTVRALQTLNEYSEAAYIIGEVEQGIGGSDMLKAGTGDATNQPRDYAVLYRSRRAART
ncbi:MAG TPA: ATP-dependent helicase, partial [Candidatus Saccharimonadales bacterium]|nr:ATP-dependent helicase [Candidatus Saccharimonadales bacterium]